MNGEKFLVNPADFASVHITVSFQNVTSRSEPLPTEQVTLQEIEKDGVILELPANCCNTQHSVIIELTRHDPERREPLHFRSTGKVTSIEPTDEKAVIRAKVTLLQYEESTWQDFHTLNDNRQKEISLFLSKTRG